MMTEEWVYIPEGNGNYMVSNTGRVRSLSRTVKCRIGVRVYKGKELKTKSLRSGYQFVSIYGKQISVHRIVASCFIPNPENKPEVNHIDGNRCNNNLSNLEWVTRSENATHAFKLLGNYTQNGERCGRSKLKDSEVRSIKKMYMDGYRVGELSNKFMVHQTTISKIIHGQNWNWI